MRGCDEALPSSGFEDLRICGVEVVCKILIVIVDLLR